MITHVHEALTTIVDKMPYRLGLDTQVTGQVYLIDPKLAKPCTNASQDQDGTQMIKLLDGLLKICTYCFTEANPVP